MNFGSNIAADPEGDVDSVAWLVCDGKKYLAVGGAATGGGNINEVQIFEFDP